MTRPTTAIIGIGFILVVLLFVVAYQKDEDGARRFPLFRFRPGAQRNVNGTANENRNAPSANTNAPGDTGKETGTATGAQFGVIAGRNIADPAMLSYAQDLGAQWIRVNYQFARAEKPALTTLLDAGFNLVVTFKNDDPSNINTAYGTYEEWPSAGFPYKDKQRYQTVIREALTPVLPYLGKGRQVWAQAENEVTDASVNKKGKYWRGTTGQYLALLGAFSETVHALDPRLKVVLSSISSGELEAVITASNPQSANAQKHVAELLSKGQYDAVDLHFYHCAENIPAKVAWVKQRLPRGRQWISTENGGPDSRCAATPKTYDQDPGGYERLQAAQVTERLTACAQNGGSVCLWFSLFDLTGEVSVFAHMGLLTRENPPQKKPAYQAFQSFVAQ